MTYLPPLGAFLGEFSEHYVLLRVLLLVLLPADLYEVGVSRHPPPGLSVSLSYSRHLFGLQDKRFYQKHASFHVAVSGVAKKTTCSALAPQGCLP